MAIFSSFLKSPPESPITRSVPNGGLGGFVQLRGKEKNNGRTEGGRSETERMDTSTAARTRKHPPPPIRVNSVDIDNAPAQSAPLTMGNDERTSPAALWKVSHPPIKSATGTTFVVAEVEVQDLHDLSSKLLWKESNGAQSKVEGATGTQDEALTANATKKLPSPVELPGSLLLPDQGLGSDVAKTSPSNNSKRPRAYSEQPSTKSSDAKVESMSSASSEPQATKTAQRGHKVAKQFRSDDRTANSTGTNTPTQSSPPTKETSALPSINVLSAEELIKVLPKMKARKLATQWLPAMEKEIGKYKGLLHMYSNRTEVHARHIDSICLDLQNLLRAMKNSSGIPNEQFEKAQADIDAQQRTDLEKLQHTEDELAEALQACSSASQEIDIRAPEFQHLKTVLYRVVATLGGCIRNNLAFKLYHSPEGLSEEVVKVLRAYKQWDDHTLKTFPALVPAEVFESAEKRAKDLQQQVTECQRLIAEQQMTIARNTETKDELSNQLEQSRKESHVQKDRIETLEAEIATLRNGATLTADRDTLSLEHDKVISEDTISELAADEIITLYTRQSGQLEQTNSVIIEQNALIEELLKQVHDASNAHDHETRSTVSADDYIQAGQLHTNQGHLERRSSSRTRKRLLGSRTLSRAITPISRSMSSLLSPHDSDPALAFSQSDVKHQNSQEHDQSSIAETAELDAREISHWSDEEEEEEEDEEKGEDIIQPSTTKRNIMLPYPRDSIMGLESLARLKLATQQSLRRTSAFRSPSPRRTQPQAKRSSTVQDQPPPSTTTAQANHNNNNYQPLRSSFILPYPDVGGRLEEPQEPSQIPSISITSHQSTPSIPHSKTIIQGLRDVQLPARLVSDKRTMSEQEKKTLSLINERSTEIGDTSPSMTVGIAV